jgi:hypothetical protein
LSAIGEQALSAATAAAMPTTANVFCFMCVSPLCVFWCCFMDLHDDDANDAKKRTEDNGLAHLQILTLIPTQIRGITMIGSQLTVIDS